nr:uncharacterized protein LOC109190933 [Ipomoea trifida]
MKDICNRPQLELVEQNGRFLMPKASYSLHRTNQLAVYEWLETLKLPDGFSSNLATCVDSTSSKLIGMKSHDCHIFMQFLLPIAFMYLPSCHWKPLTELSAFFRNLCSTSLRVDNICEMEKSIVLTLCKLERFFPPALFDCMEHLPVHLPYEARLGGPVQYRWMYPFERFLNHLKSKMKNKRYVEGSIADAYMLEESTHFASIYFDDDVQSRRTRIGRNLNDGGIDPNLPITLSIFNRPGRSMGKRKTRYLSAEEYFAAHQYVLLNCEENPGCTDQDVDDEIERNFAHWFKEYVHSPMNNVCNQSLIDLACGPIMEVSTYMGYVVNGFKFQTEAYCYRKSTFNYGVSIKGSGLAQLESNFFGTLQEVVEVEYPNVPIKKVVLFKCEWFDPTPNVGSRFNSEYGIAEVHCNKRYRKYDPFIIAQSACQVCYIPYPREDEATIRKIYEKSAAKRLSDTLSQVRANLREGKPPPKWMSDAVLAQYQTLWDNADFKRLSEKNKKNRNSYCGGMGPSLHTGGSIPMTEHRRRLKEKLGEEPSHAALFQATHKRKNTDNFVCKKAQHVMFTANWSPVYWIEIVTQKQQTQPELDQSIVWYEATGGLKKGGYVFGFGSDTQHYFPEVATQKKSTYGGSSSHEACDERIGQLEKTKDEILEQNKIIIELLRRAHPELLQSITHAVDSNQGSDIGLDNLNVNDDTQSPV